MLLYVGEWEWRTMAANVEESFRVACAGDNGDR